MISALVFVAVELISEVFDIDNIPDKVSNALYQVALWAIAIEATAEIAIMAFC